MLGKHEVEAEHNNELINLYNEARKKWTSENGSCLNSDNYKDHWNKREDYIKNLMCAWYEKNGYCKGCKYTKYDNELLAINQTLFKKYYDQAEIGVENV